jgi:hypothetical protein
VALLKKNMFSELAQHMPNEDYFTTCFSFLLRQDRKLTHFLLKEILKREYKVTQVIRNLEPSDLEVNAQETFSIEGGRREIDIKISAKNDLVVLIENKLGAQATKAQIRDYLKIAKNLQDRGQAKEAYVMLITNRDIPRELALEAKEQNFLHLRWSDIAALLGLYSARQLPYEEKYYLSSFLEFVEEKGILSFKGFFATDYGAAWQKYSEFKDNAKTLLDELKSPMKRRGFEAREKAPIEGDEEIGLSFRKKNWKWTVRLWIGFDLAPRVGESQDRVWYSVYLTFRKRFREELRKNFDQTAEAESFLEDDFEVEWDQDHIYRSEELARLPRNMQQQKRMFFKFVDSAIDKLEKSGILSLVDKTLKE